MSLSLGDLLEEGVQEIILAEGRGQMESGGDNHGMGSLGWFRVVVPTTSWMAPIVIRMIPSRTALFIAYEAAIFTHVVSSLDWG